ncbi:MAG: PepSY-associated TM helix domain-containing protein [Hyphomonas sp.]|uniref:PepSY-associated TM helix domain-containing protein n=1 Tax=Hyphomonas sp. TaxID=87 RepID=UPI003528210B
MVIFVLAATGVLLTYERQIIAAAEAALVTDIEGDRLTADQLVVLAQEIGGESATVRIPASTNDPVKVLAAGEQTLLHPVTGSTLLVGPTSAAKVFETITLVHRWLAPTSAAHPLGKSVTNIATLLFIFLAMSGLYLWTTPVFRWAILKSKLKLNLRPPTAKARDYNWHHVFGFWMFVPILVMSVTGTVIAYAWANALVFAAFGEAPQSLRAPRVERAGVQLMEVPVDAVSLQRRLEEAATRVANWNTITLPAYANLAEPTPYDIDYGNGAQPHRRLRVVVSPQGGVIEQTETFRERSAGTRARLIIRFLHTGEVLGLIGQTLAGLGSLATLVCPHESGPLFELVPASDMELRHGQEINA